MDTYLGQLGMAATCDGSGLPGFVKQLPKADLPAPELQGWVMKGERGVVVFMQAEEDVTVPAHRHGPQWGVVLAGTMTLTMDGVTRTYQRGDTHFIPAGVEHEATLHAGWSGVYVFPRD